MLGVEQWAEIRRLGHVERLSQQEIHGRTGLHRDTIRRALAAPERRATGRARDEPTVSGVRVAELLDFLADAGSKTILDDHLRETRPRFLPTPRSFQRTRYANAGR